MTNLRAALEDDVLHTAHRQLTRRRQPRGPGPYHNALKSLGCFVISEIHAQEIWAAETIVTALKPLTSSTRRARRALVANDANLKSNSAESLFTINGSALQERILLPTAHPRTIASRRR